MELTPEQSEIVSENHNLIYGVAQDFNLDTEEWYGTLAIKLCETVIAHEPKKGTLSTLYYNIISNYLKSHHRADGALKRQDGGLLSLDHDYAEEGGSFTLYDTELPLVQDSVEDIILNNERLSNLLNGPYGDIVRLRYLGYTQEEIASTMNFTQQYISEVLKDIRREYDDGDFD